VEPDALFLATLRDLHGRSSALAVSEYDVLRSALLLRQLLLDSTPLAHQVNRDRHVPLRFRVNVRDPIWKIAGTEPPAVWIRQDGFDPETALTASQVAELRLDPFLACVVMMIEGRDFTVRDVVMQTAHVLGGVHTGTPRAQEQQALAELSAAFRVGGLDPVVRQLQAIGRVVVRALDPLRTKIEAGD